MKRRFPQDYNRSNKKVAKTRRILPKKGSCDLSTEQIVNNLNQTQKIYDDLQLKNPLIPLLPQWQNENKPGRPLGDRPREKTPTKEQMQGIHRAETLNTGKDLNDVGEKQLPLVTLSNSFAQSVVIRNTRFHDAIQQENFTQMKVLLTNPNRIYEIPNHFGETSITYAIRLHKINVVQYLLKKGVKSISPFIDIAALQNELVKHDDYGSLNRLADRLEVNRIDVKTGCAPLHFAVRHKNIEMVKFLLFKQANVNCLDGAYNTPLHVSILNNNFAIAELLLQNNANPMIPNGQNMTALDLARQVWPNKTLGGMINQYKTDKTLELADIQSILQVKNSYAQQVEYKILGSDLIAATIRGDIEEVSSLLANIDLSNICSFFAKALNLATQNNNQDLIGLLSSKYNDYSKLHNKRSDIAMQNDCAGKIQSSACFFTNVSNSFDLPSSDEANTEKIVPMSETDSWFQ